MSSTNAVLVAKYLEDEYAFDREFMGVGITENDEVIVYTEGILRPKFMEIKGVRIRYEEPKDAD